MPRTFRPSAHRSRLHRSMLAIALGAVSLLAPGAAQAATPAAVSPVTGKEVRLDGARVQVSPSATPSTAFLRSVEGRTVTVACFAGVQQLLESAITNSDGLPTTAFDAALLGGPVQWPAGARSLAYDLPRDVSATADGCMVGRTFELATMVGFSPEAQAVLAEETAEQTLVLAHRAAQDIARSRQDRRFPAARDLAGAIARAEPQMKVAYARDVAAAHRSDVVYVVGAGTDFKRVRLAYRPQFGDALRLVGGRRGRPAHVHHAFNEVPVPASGPGDRRSPFPG